MRNEAYIVQETLGGTCNQPLEVESKVPELTRDTIAPTRVYDLLLPQKQGPCGPCSDPVLLNMKRLPVSVPG